MKHKLETIFKKVLVIAMCVLSVFTAIFTSIPTAKADSSEMLGSKSAIGSPILNPNFTVDDWNKWEIICWGVFLSNFCQPLIDTYETAFKVGAGSGTLANSNGAGYKALCFGSGNDLANKDVIESFCDYAIMQQREGQLKQIYVTYTHVTIPNDGEWDVDDSKADPADADIALEAHFNDLFVKDGATADVTSSALISANPNSATNAYTFDDNYANVMHATECYLPTFWIRNDSGNYVKILDYMNYWDMQMVSSMINAVRTDQDFKSTFQSQWDNLWDEQYSRDSASRDTALQLDVFGNIILPDGTMVVPAAVNQNITKDRKINLLNSWVFNSYNSTYGSSSLIEGLTQGKLRDGKIFKVNGIFNGLPAFSSSKIGNVGLLYYDMDSIMVSDYALGSVSIGEALKKLFELDVAKNSNKYPLKFEITGMGTDFYKGGEFTVLGETTLTASLLSNRPNSSALPQPVTLDYLITMDGSKVKLFSSDPVIVAPRLATDESGFIVKNSDGVALRHFYNFLYRAYKGQTSETTSGSIKENMDGILAAVTVDDFVKEGKDIWPKFQSYNTDFSKTTYPDGVFRTMFNSANDQAGKDSIRLCLVYPVSETLKAVSSVLGVRDGTEFSTYSSMIYMTYLSFYGVADQTTFTSGTEKVSDFNEEIYDTDSDILCIDPGDINPAGFKTKEQKEDEVLEMSYLMLHPTAGRDYRKQLIYNGVSDFIYEQYNRIVYGGSSDSYAGSASKSNSGFLAVERYNENWLTSWFLNSYVDIAVWAIAICVIAVVIIGLLKTRKLSWYAFSIFTVVNVILIVPSSGEIVPYITSNFVQKMFSSKMTSWSIAEGVTNAKVEADATTQSGGMEKLEKDEALTAVKLIKQLNVVYVDRSLMLKQDISQKLTQQLGGVYTEIQQLQSARWVLPMVMQQFTNSDDIYGSLYVKLSNVWDDASNLYWYYKPEESQSVTKPTTTSEYFHNDTGENAATTALDDEKRLGAKAREVFQDYVEPTWKDDTDTDINYANYSYTIRDDIDIVHLYSWMLPDGNRMVASREIGGLSGDYANYEDADSWQKYIKLAPSNATKSNWVTTRDDGKPDDNYVKSGFEKVSENYDRNNPTTLKAGYSFYKTTESPLYYFFNVVKDCFDADASIGSVIGRLQGQIEEDEDGNEVRTNLMYASSTSSKEEDNGMGEINNADVVYTPYIRDVIDLQNFFNNVVPYMYQITLMTGGFDGESGLLTEQDPDSPDKNSPDLIPLLISEDSTFYAGNAQSWAYRCNWAVKLMENPEYSRPVTVRDKAGNKLEIRYPILPDSYPDSRPMIFSEAQMYAEGLKESDLNVVELKCIEVNKEVAKSWTLLINYAGTQGLTKEVLYRQMATDATEIFCREFSSGGILNNMYGIYPQSIDLRYLSFDSVMKMLMLNVSKDTSYIYGDTMSTLIEETDMVTAIMLLLSAFLCAYVIPMARTILMALIFYLGFLAIIKALFSSAKYKGKIACGQFISNVLFMVYTLVYYACFSGLMAVTASDEVLSLNHVQSNAGNPVWVLIAVVLISGLYIFAMAAQIKFCFEHYRDMGFEMYAQVASATTGKLSDAISSIGGSISGWFGGDTGTTSATSNTNSIKGTGIAKKDAQDVNIRQASGSTISVETTHEAEDEEFNDITASAYTTDQGQDFVDDGNSDEIDAEIEAGRHMGSD